MKLTSEEFNELQRWMKVRDYCQEAKTCLRLVTEYAMAIIMTEMHI